MKTIALPYGHASLDLHVEEEHLEAVVETRMGELEPDPSEEELVRQALANPIGTPRLRDLARDKNHIVLVTSDHTRAVPSRLTLPILLAEIRRGNPEAQITILIATGLHRVTTEQEQRRMFGDVIVDGEDIVCNDAFDPTQFVDMGTLPSGASFKVNRLATECDLLMCEGFIEPHFFAGVSGGRKSILPGICAEETVKENHSYQA
ncbi:MAG: lactate racemase domain-containing protein, partial [Atopobiaceae bacterium]|nr:lactate racemase domain-containing protein [Atopobiaceae bacterium]